MAQNAGLIRIDERYKGRDKVNLIGPSISRNLHGKIRSVLGRRRIMPYPVLRLTLTLYPDSAPGHRAYVPRNT